MTDSRPFSAAFHHVSISVADLDAQQRWYQEALGLDEVVECFELPEPPVRTTVLRGSGGLQVELIERAGSGRVREFDDPLDASRDRGYGHWAIAVDDLAHAFAHLTEAGGTPVWPPAPAVRPGARFAYVKDPEGNLIELIEGPHAD
ncbi:VOC family protein [Streptomyces sp. SL13]|uniref:VOC family protein n=1 Tax=Streptantibioticus silvisoli TaxID=2705255 RepID=A0AA90KBT1_9ACTN|nr:VOC family protein [Streptantibioticus silvisoli]MDI5967082.1 VOC family protein [Streptantibioticus silvisoli]MDI5973737.1 VOC family protein [Streptantibioticus silvisoli]